MAVEAKIAALEGGIGAMATSSDRRLRCVQYSIYAARVTALYLRLLSTEEP